MKSEEKSLIESTTKLRFTLRFTTKRNSIESTNKQLK